MQIVQTVSGCQSTFYSNGSWSPFSGAKRPALEVDHQPALVPSFTSTTPYVCTHRQIGPRGEKKHSIEGSEGLRALLDILERKNVCLSGIVQPIETVIIAVLEVYV
jgi:hypothetical protein